MNDLLKEVEEAGVGVQLCNDRSMTGMLFADDFVGVSDSRENSQKLIDVVHNYCNRWRLKANVSKSAVMVFARNQEEGEWMWGEHRLPRVCSYRYLGIDFACNGAWDVYVKKVIDSGRTKLNQLHSVINPRRACAARVTVVGSVCLCVCVSVCLLSHISPMERLFVLKTLSRTQRATKVKIFVGFSLKMLRCKARAVPALYG